MLFRSDKDMSLDENSKTMIFQILSKGIYSNPIGSVVREITSNCFDSHVEAGVDLPVRIRLSLDKMTNTQYISFIDYGDQCISFSQGNWFVTFIGHFWRGPGHI